MKESERVPWGEREEVNPRVACCFHCLGSGTAEAEGREGECAECGGLGGLDRAGCPALYGHEEPPPKPAAPDPFAERVFPIIGYSGCNCPSETRDDPGTICKWCLLQELLAQTAADATAAERERCAKVSRTLALKALHEATAGAVCCSNPNRWPREVVDLAATEIAAAIRRGE